MPMPVPRRGSRLDEEPFDSKTADRLEMPAITGEDGQLMLQGSGGNERVCSLQSEPAATR